MTDKITQLLTKTDKTVFSTRDLANIWQYGNYRSLIQRIHYSVKTGKLEKIRKGLYAVPGRPVNDLELGNKLRTPSYISFETVLLREGVIFQWDSRIQFAGPESISIVVGNQEYIFRQMKKEILLAVDGIERENNYYIATKERAYLDMLYTAPSFYFDNVRSIDFDLCKRLAPLYKNKSLVTNLQQRETYAQQNET